MTESKSANSDHADSAERTGPGSSAIVGTLIGGDFEIRRKIGQGGMGTVYEAWQKSLNREVAIKVLGSSIGIGSSAVLRFKLEAQAAAKLHHTNIVPIFAQGEHDGLYFYVMELVEGRSLSELIADLRGDKSSTALELTETRLIVGSDANRTDAPDDSDATDSTPAVPNTTTSESGRSAISASTAATFDEIAEQMAAAADALDYAHKHGVIHRDIKPHNFLYGDDGRLRVADFGLARVLEQPGVTMTGEFIGSPLYMSPEQITGGQIQVGPRTDIYSLGATMYEWLTLQPPFPGDSREQVISKIITSEPSPPRSLDARIPLDLDTICMKALEKSPSRRYATAAAMAEDLRRFRRNETIRAKREGVVGRAGKFIDRNRVAVLVAGVVVALGSILWSVQSQRARTETKAVIAENEQLAERVETLEEEKRRFAEQMGDLPLERSVADFGATLLSGMASAVTDSGLFELTDTPPQPPGQPLAPSSTTEAIVLTQQDHQLIDLLADEFTDAIRKSAAKRVALGRPDNPSGRIAAEYFREALAATTPEKALALVNLTLQNEFDHFGALNLRSILYMRLSKFSEGIQDARMMVNFRQDSALGYVMRGLAQFFLGHLEEGLRDLGHAIQLDPRSAGVWVARGAVRLRAGQYLAAFDDLDRALGLSPGNRAAMLERENANVRIRYSVRQATESINRNPDGYDLLIRRGDLYYLLGQYPEAMEDYRKALSLNDVPTPYLIEKLWRTRKKLNEPEGSKPASRTQSTVQTSGRTVVVPKGRSVTLRLLSRLLP